MRKMFFLFLLSFPIFLWASPPSEKEQIQFFQKAHQDSLSEEAEILLHLDMQKLKGSVLQIYPQYWLLERKMHILQSKEINNFLRKYPRDFLTQVLLSDWVGELFERGEYRKIPLFYRKIISPSFGLRCLQWKTQVLLGKAQYSDFFSKIRASFSSPDFPDECFPLVEDFWNHHLLHKEDVWVHIRNLVESKKISSAVLYAGLLTKNKQMVAGFNRIHRDTYRFLLYIKEREVLFRKEFIVMSLSYLAKVNFDQAVFLWNQVLKEISFSENQKEYVNAHLAYQACIQHRGDSLLFIKKVRHRKKLLPLFQEWFARAALRNHSWKKLISFIREMPYTLRHSDTWIYWKAYALFSLGEKEKAVLYWKKISTKYSYYGLLANERLKRKTRVPSVTYSYNKEIYENILHQTGVSRAILLHRAGYFSLAMKEWNWATRHLSQDELLSSAHVASDYKMFDRAISSASRVHSLRGFFLRYPMPYYRSVMFASQKFQINPSWIYGITRQESRFMETVKSSAGACGLMQLMPRTAKIVSKKFRILKRHIIEKIVDPRINIFLGSAYLQWVYHSFSRSFILAAAAYNAGPKNADLWRGKVTLPAAVYIETIPFSETRQYVKAVLSNVRIYELILEKKKIKTHSASLAHLMTDIPSIDHVRTPLSQIP